MPRTDGDVADLAARRIEAAVKQRDAQWRDALRGDFGEEFWRTSGPQNPEEAAIFEREGGRVDSTWRHWMMGERDRVRDGLRDLLAAARPLLSPDPGEAARAALATAIADAQKLLACARCAEDEDDEDEPTPPAGA